MDGDGHCSGEGRRSVIVTGSEVGEWVCARTKGTWEPGCAQAVGWSRDGVIVAGVVFDQWNGAQVCMHVASDGSRKWLNREFLSLCFHYAFEQLKVKRITGLVAASNTQALRFDEHLGFVREATLADAAPDGDLIVLRMYKHECKWIGVHHGWKVLSPAAA